MEIIIAQVTALLAMCAICTLLIVFGYKEAKYNKKIDFLSHLVDKGYESKKIDLNKL